LLFVLIRQLGFRYRRNEYAFRSGWPEIVIKNPATASVATTNSHGLSCQEVAKFGTYPIIPPYL
jgi:hypothetical protein